MRYLILVVTSALADFGRNKGRTFLTSLGIVIGVLSVVLVSAFGAGLKHFVRVQFESLGVNTLYIYPGKLLDEGGNFGGDGGLSGAVRFDLRDVGQLERLTGVQAITPLFKVNGEVSAEGKTKYVETMVGNADIFKIWNIKAEYGSLFNQEQAQKYNKIIVIGSKLAKDLFGASALALGRNIKIRNQSFRIIAVAESKSEGSLGGLNFDSFAYIPLKTGYMFNPKKEFMNIMISCTNEQAIPKLKADIIKILSNRYETDDFSVIEQKEILNAVTSIFNVMNIVLLAIAIISLIVGGIGIMNIMYVTVSERVKEIGVRRAIGARKLDILAQFVIEAVIISVFGGLFGLFLAFLISVAVSNFFPVIITLESILLALGVSGVIGMVFGVFPAKKAADLSPIEAIRYE